MKIRKVISIAVVTAFIAASVKSPAYAQSEQGWMSSLPVPGVMVRLSPEFSPAHLAGVTIHPDNALQFDFLINKGDQDLEGDQKKEEYQKLVKYFLASLTIPDKDQWVNLSPYENDRIIKDNFGKTEMGRDLLAEDYLLKQITSSLIYPEDGLGKKFWDKVYARAWKEYHTTDIPVNTFNKVWIVPDQAYVYESGNTAYILKSHLKVMLEEDYLSLKNHSASASSGVHSIGSQVIREIILPELEKEVNEGKNFANLRQMYSGMILATWYKKALKESLLGQVYADKAKVAGVNVRDPKADEEIYQRYLKAFKKGVFNYIKDDVDRYTNEAIPRKYFSGGFNRVDPAMAGRSSDVTVVRDLAMLPEKIKAGIAEGLNAPMDRATVILNAHGEKPVKTDAAMQVRNLTETEINELIRSGSYQGRVLVFPGIRETGNAGDMMNGRLVEVSEFRHDLENGEINALEANGIKQFVYTGKKVFEKAAVLKAEKPEAVISRGPDRVFQLTGRADDLTDDEINNDLAGNQGLVHQDIVRTTGEIMKAKVVSEQEVREGLRDGSIQAKRIYGIVQFVYTQGMSNIKREITEDLPGDAWVEAGSYTYKIWVEDGKAKLQRFDEKYQPVWDAPIDFNLGVENIIGRSLLKDDRMLSRNHFKFLVTGNEKDGYKIALTDLGSLMGTTVTLDSAMLSAQDRKINSQYTILVAEDSPDIASMIVQYLHVLGGFNVEMAVDGEQALDIFNKNTVKPFAVLSDYQMPKMDGLQLADALHKIDPTLKVVIHSGYDKVKFEQEIQLKFPQGRPANIVEILEKPSSMRQSIDIFDGLRIQAQKNGHGIDSAMSGENPGKGVRLHSGESFIIADYGTRGEPIELIFPNEYRSVVKIIRVDQMFKDDPSYNKVVRHIPSGYVMSDGAGGMIELKNGVEVILGSFFNEDAFPWLTDSGISRGHVTIKREGNRITLRDGMEGAHSENGTIIGIGTYFADKRRALEHWLEKSTSAIKRGDLVGAEAILEGVEKYKMDLDSMEYNALGLTWHELQKAESDAKNNAIYEWNKNFPVNPITGTNLILERKEFKKAAEILERVQKYFFELDGAYKDKILRDMGALEMARKNWNGVLENLRVSFDKYIGDGELRKAKAVLGEARRLIENQKEKDDELEGLEKFFMERLIYEDGIRQRALFNWQDEFDAALNKRNFVKAKGIIDAVRSFIQEFQVVDEEDTFILGLRANEAERKLNTARLGANTNQKSDSAMKGGIDFNAAGFNLQIKRDGNGVPLPLARQDMARLKFIQGFEPEIIEIKPAVNLPFLSALQQKLQTSST